MDNIGDIQVRNWIKSAKPVAKSDHTWHFAVNDSATGERVMHRIVVNGPPFSPEVAAAA